MNDAEIAALEAQYAKAVYESDSVPGANVICFDSNLIEKGVRRLLDEVKLLNLQNDQMRKALEKIRDYIDTDYPLLSRAKEMAQEAITEKRICVLCARADSSCEAHGKPLGESWPKVE
jgi:hypothetical protein